MKGFENGQNDIYQTEVYRPKQSLLNRHPRHKSNIVILNGVIPVNKNSYIERAAAISLLTQNSFRRVTKTNCKKRTPTIQSTTTNLQKSQGSWTSNLKNNKIKS